MLSLVFCMKSGCKLTVPYVNFTLDIGLDSFGKVNKILYAAYTLLPFGLVLKKKY